METHLGTGSLSTNEGFARLARQDSVVDYACLIATDPTKTFSRWVLCLPSKRIEGSVRWRFTRLEMRCHLGLLLEDISHLWKEIREENSCPSRGPSQYSFEANVGRFAFGGDEILWELQGGGEGVCQRSLWPRQNYNALNSLEEFDVWEEDFPKAITPRINSVNFQSNRNKKSALA